MKKIFFLFFVCLITVTAQGQNSYYATDSTLHSGIKVIDGGGRLNSQFCRVKLQDSIVEFTPDQIKEYKIKNGSVYLSKLIPTSNGLRKVFLERLEKGKTTLYFYRGKKKKTYFVEKDSLPLMELPKYADSTGIYFHVPLKKIIDDTPGFNDAIMYAAYTRNSLTKIFKEYNAGEMKPLPHLKFGLTAGYELMKLHPLSSFADQYVEKSSFKYDGGFTVGFFVDNPILLSDLSLHAELFYSKHGYSISQSRENKDIDFVANISTVKLPILIRYTYPSHEIRPFINAGGIVAYHFKNEYAIYQALLNNDQVEISNVIKEPFLQKESIGLSIGGGMEYKLDYKRSLFFELRFNRFLSKADSNSMNSSNLSLTTGINF